MQDRGPKDEYKRLDKRKFIILVIAVAIGGAIIAEILNIAVKVLFGW